MKRPTHDRFVLKGGLLMAAFTQRRPTRDVDLLALDLDNDEEVVRDLVRSIAGIVMDDGLELDAAMVRATSIR